MGILGLFGKKKAPEPPKEVKKLRPFPFTVDGANLRFAYDYTPTPAADGAIAAALGDAEKVVDVGMDGSTITLIHGGRVFATIEDESRAKMVSDYLRRGDPVNAVLRENGTVSLRFYRDMRKGAEGNRQTVVELTACKAQKYQDAIYGMAVGQELGCFGSDQIYVCDYFDQGAAVIGKMPAKVVKETETSSIRALYLEQLLEVGDKFVPVVRIYWSDKA